MSRLIRYTVTLDVDSEGWDALMEDEDGEADTRVRADLLMAVYDFDPNALVQVDGE